MKRIAITGVTGDARRVLVQALSYLTGYDVVRQTAYASQAIKFELNREVKERSWDELFVYALSSFCERMEIEQHFDFFVSNGSVFNELAIMNTLNEINSKKDRKNKERDFIYTGSQRIILEYASRTYDCIIHISDCFDENDFYLHQLDRNLMNLIQGCRLIYVVQKNAILVDILEQVTIQTGIKSILSPGTALKKAQLDIIY